jgi:hypothetical protein
MIKIVLAKVLSKLWYADPVWLSKSVLKQKEIYLLDSAVENILRHKVKDYKKAFKREELHSLKKFLLQLNGVII